MEVGRECADEVGALRRLRALSICEQELKGRLHMRRCKGGNDANTRALEARLEETKHKKQVVLEELIGFEQRPDRSTGHAFVVFNFESDRNLLVEQCRGSTTQRIVEMVLPASLRSALCPTGFSLRPWDAASGRRVRVEAAPEPDDVKWENLQLDECFEARQVVKTLTITCVLLGVALVILVLLHQVQAETTPDRVGEWDWFMSLDEESRLQAASLITALLSLFASLVTTAINFALKAGITTMTTWEARDTQTDFETSIFNKLSLAYVFNSVVLPFAVGVVFSLRATDNQHPVNQSWYEAGGVVNQAIFLMISNALVAEVLKVIQPATLVQRYVLSRWAVSQPKLNNLWAPPDMLLGELYAANLKTVALCLIYAPLWPWAYLLTAVALALSYWCTKFAVAYWYKKPPMVSEEMMSSFRSRLGFIMLLHAIVAIFASKASSDRDDSEPFAMGAAASAPVTATIIVWALYELLDVPDCLAMIPGLKRFDELRLRCSNARSPTQTLARRNSSLMHTPSRPLIPTPLSVPILALRPCERPSSRSCTHCSIMACVVSIQCHPQHLIAALAICPCIQYGRRRHNGYPVPDRRLKAGRPRDAGLPHREVRVPVCDSVRARLPASPLLSRLHRRGA